MWKGTKGTT
jgi:AcrR family transcriptional regulator